MIKKSYVKENNTDSLLDYRELSKRLKVCRKTAENLVKNGTISQIKVGKCVRFDWETVKLELKKASSSQAA